MSRPPNVAAAFSIAPFTCASSRTSTTSGSAFPPALVISSAAVKIVPANSHRRKRLLGKEGAAGREREQPQIRCRSGQRRREVVALAAKEPMRGALQRLGCVLEPHASPPESRVVVGIDGFDRALDLADIGLHRRTACVLQLARNEIHGLDAVSSFVNRRDAPVSVLLRSTSLFDVTHAAMNLHAKGCDLVAD